MADRPTILVVDDEREILDTLRRRLLLEGLTIAMTTDPQDAIEQMREQLFPIVISDIKMPGMSGIELLQALKKLNPLCNVIIMTGYSSMSHVVECLGRGAVDYFVKPFQNLDELVDAVLQVKARVERWKKAMSIKTIEAN